MPSFGDLLQWLQANRMYLNVEIKPGGFLSEVGERTVQALEQYRMKERCIISSFDHHILREIKQCHPDYQVGILYSQPNDDIVNYCLKYRFDAIHPYYKLISKSLVHTCHQNGIAVNVWTVDEPDDIRRMIEWGVDAVISNDAAEHTVLLHTPQKTETTASVCRRLCFLRYCFVHLSLFKAATYGQPVLNLFQGRA